MTPNEIAETLVREICYLGNGNVYRDATKERFVKVIAKAITEAVEEERVRQMAPMDCGHPFACFSPWGGGADNLPKPPDSLPDCLACRAILEERRACAEIARKYSPTEDQRGMLIQKACERGWSMLGARLLFPAPTCPHKEIQMAEKKILIAEIEKNADLQAQLAQAREALAQARKWIDWPWDQKDVSRMTPKEILVLIAKVFATTD